MRFSARALTALLAVFASAVLARSPDHLRRMHGELLSPNLHARDNTASPPTYQQPNSTTIIPQNERTKKFKVDGKAIPDVHFDVGESYAGLLPISDQKNASELYFWFFPSHNPSAEDEILIWLNGGPGCSSLEGLLQENGPFLWQYGTFRPVQNQYTWVNLTNVVWVEYPPGTGFSQVNGDPQVTNEVDAAAQFLGFWKNFVDTFDLHHRRIFISGESYAGYYVPYISDAMHNKTDKKYYNIESSLMFDPSLTYSVVQSDIVAVPFIDYWAGLFIFNDTLIKDLHTRAEKCGYNEFLSTALTFPPKGPLPTPPNSQQDTPGCALWTDVYNAALLTNPCWDVYQVATTCPILWDVLGFPGSIPYLPDGATIYFNRTEVQRAINAPLQPWAECQNALSTDTSAPSALSVLPRVIEKNKKTLIAHGALDFVLVRNGTLIAINNMTFHGKQGFSSGPNAWDNFFVPYHSELSLSNVAGAGNFGKWHTERGLTYVEVDLSGHMIPQYAPSAAYRILEFLLGRVENLGVRGDFTTQKGDFGNNFNFVTANVSGEGLPMNSSRMGLL